MRFSIILKRLAEKHDVSFRECTEHHIQLKALHTVNVYESTQCFYVNGMSKKENFSVHNPLNLIRIAKGESDLKIKDEKVKRKSFKKTKRLFLFQKNPTCFFCGDLLTDWESATIEHKIPLAKGGTNRNDNLALSHHECNQERGTDIGVKK